MNMFWEIILSNAVVAGLMAIAAALIGRLWKNPAAVHVLWLAVLIKLFTPPLATLSWPAEPATPPATKIVDHHLTDEGTPHLTAVNDRDEPTVAEGPAPQVSIQPTYLGRHPAAAASFLSQLQPATLFSALWLTGSACLALAYSVRIRRFVKLMRGFTPASDETQSLVSELSTRLGLRRIPEVLTTAQTLPPLVWSMGGRPRLVLPSRLFDGLAEEARASILLHELAHVRRRDHLVRLLELAATVGFWWHPVVWWSRRRLRELEEECCDAIVLEAAPSQARTYALALLETLDFLSRTPRLGVPLPTAVHSTDSLTRRIRMLAQSRPTKLRPLPAALVAGLMALPLAVAFSADTPPGPESNTPPQTQNAPVVAKPAVIVGEVKNKFGMPVADALVRAVLPFVELRFNDLEGSYRRYEARTDAAGKYRLEIPGLDAATSIAVEVQKPGYRRSTGMPGKFPIDDRKVDVEAGKEATASFVLDHSLYFKGVAVDDAGRPVAGATIHAFEYLWQEGGWAKLWVEGATTGVDGAFELFNYSPYEPDPSIPSPRGERALVSFKHPDFVDVYTADLYRTPAKERRSLQVVMPRGKVLSGTVVDAAGEPVSGVVVKSDSFAWEPAHTSRKATTTDTNGRFVLKGLAKTTNRIRVLSTTLGQKATIEKVVENDEAGITIQLKPMDLPKAFDTHDVLGMKLTDATPEFSLAYEFPQYTGALVIAPGTESVRLGVGKLRKGFVFWAVGDKNVSNVREFVESLISATENQDGLKQGIRVTFTAVGAETDYVGTEQLRLTQADLDQLKAAVMRRTQ